MDPQTHNLTSHGHASAGAHSAAVGHVATGQSSTSTTAQLPTMPSTAQQSYPAQSVPYQQQPYGDYYQNGRRPGITLGVLSLLFAVLLPPIGFILGIVSMVKGFGRKNAGLGVMGLVALPVSAVVTIVGLLLIGTALTSSLDLGVATKITESDAVSGSSIATQMPTKIIKTSSSSNKNLDAISTYEAVSTSDLVQAKSTFIISPSSRISQLLASKSESEVKSIIQNELSAVRSGATAGQTESQVDMKELIRNYLSSSIKDVTFSPLSDTASLMGFGHSFDATTEEGIQLKGVYFVHYDITHKSTQTTLVAASEYVWSHNQEVLEAIATKAEYSE